MFPFAEPASTDRVLLLPHTLYLYCTCYLSAHRTFPMCLSDSCLVVSLSLVVYMHTVSVPHKCRGCVRGTLCLQ